MRNPIKSIRIICDPIVVAKKSDFCAASNSHISVMQFVAGHDALSGGKSFMNKLCQACFSKIGGVQIFQVKAEKNETYSLINAYRARLQRKHLLQAGFGKRMYSVTTYAGYRREKTLELFRTGKYTLNNIFNCAANKNYYHNLINFICRRFIPFASAREVGVDSSYQFELQSNLPKCKMVVWPHWDKMIACLQMKLGRSQNNKRVPIFYGKTFCLKGALFKRYPLYLYALAERFIFFEVGGSISTAVSS